MNSKSLQEQKWAGLSFEQTKTIPHSINMNSFTPYLQCKFLMICCFQTNFSVPTIIRENTNISFRLLFYNHILKNSAKIFHFLKIKHISSVRTGISPLLDIFLNSIVNMKEFYKVSQFLLVPVETFGSYILLAGTPGSSKTDSLWDIFSKAEKTDLTQRKKKVQVK